MKNKQNAEIEFEAKLEQILRSIRERAENQFKYNLSTNIPEKIGGITFDNVAQHAIDNGLVAAISQMNQWDINKALLFAHSVLEDSNAHSEANELVQFIPEYQGKYWQEKQAEKKEKLIDSIKLVGSDDYGMISLDEVVRHIESLS